MLDIAVMRHAVRTLQQRCEQLFARRKRLLAQVRAFEEEKIEHEEDQLAGASVRERLLQPGETRDAPLVERTDFAIDHAIGQVPALSGDFRKTVAPVQRLARAQYGGALLDAKLHAVAVELDLMHPHDADGRFVHQPGELKRNELRHLHALYFFRAVRLRAVAPREGPVFFFTVAGVTEGSSSFELPSFLRDDCHTFDFLLDAIS